MAEWAAKTCTLVDWPTRKFTCEELATGDTPENTNDSGDPLNCSREYDENVCDGCTHNNHEIVAHPGGESTASAEKHHCEQGYWEDDF